METKPDLLLLLCPKISNRLKYASRLLLEELLGLKVDLTSNQKRYENCDGAKMHYAPQPVSPSGVFVYSSGFLEKTAIEPFEPEVDCKSTLPLVFPNGSTTCALGFDVFAASFYLVSRYEEYLPGGKDQHGRFKAEASFAFRNGFLEIPLVNHYACQLKKMLQHFFPSLAFREHRFTFIPTYDIDVAYAYRGRSIIRGLGASFRSMYKQEFGEVAERILVLAGRKSDPFDTFDLQLLWHNKYGLEPYYFFLCGKQGRFDYNISRNFPAFQNLVKAIGKSAHIGIHPSYASAGNPKLLLREISDLSAISGKSIKFSRQHYLKFTLPDTYRVLIQNNIEVDFSMGYASLPGFRASIASPFKFYDLLSDKPAGLTIYPFAVMDGTLNDYMKLTPSQAISKNSDLISEVRKVNGTFISLWHNDSLSERVRWKGWLKVYESLIKMATEKS